MRAVSGGHQGIRSIAIAIAIARARHAAGQATAVMRMELAMRMMLVMARIGGRRHGRASPHFFPNVRLCMSIPTPTTTALMLGLLGLVALGPCNALLAT